MKFTEESNMKVIKIALAVTFLFSISSCSRQFKIARVVPGETYIDQAVDILDEPDIAEKSSVSPRHMVYIWQDVTLQVDQNEIITAVHRKPANHEGSLQFWKQHYQDNQTSFNNINSQGNSQESLWQFSIPSKGMSVIYNENNDKVVKVILYETK
jgi:hypothetical protein